MSSILIKPLTPARLAALRGRAGRPSPSPELAEGGRRGTRRVAFAFCSVYNYISCE